jgi:leucine-rich repeat-containing protein 49
MWWHLFCSFESVSCLAESTSLSDITFDGNPIAQESWYKHTVLQNMMQLRQLDMKRITVSALLCICLLP